MWRSWLARQIVALKVVGSTPITLPRNSILRKAPAEEQVPFDFCGMFEMRMLECEQYIMGNIQIDDISSMR